MSKMGIKKEYQNVLLFIFENIFLRAKKPHKKAIFEELENNY